MKSHNSFQYILFFVIVFFFGLMNMYGTESPNISLFVALSEYMIIFSLIITGNYYKAFFYYLAFTATILEFDTFIYGENASAHVRYSFANLPIFTDYLRWLLAYFFAIVAYSDYSKRKIRLPKTMLFLKEWLILLFISGSISVIVGLIFNDNSVLNSGVFPEVAILNILQYLVKACIIMTTVFLLLRDGWKEQCSNYILLIIITVALITVVAALLGFVGQYNGRETILIAPLAVALTPMLILFIFKQGGISFHIFAVLSGIAAVISSFVYGGTAIGSKWYIILLLVAAGLIITIFKIRSISVLAIGGLVCLLVLPVVILPILSLFDENTYAAVKLDQALSTMNIFGAHNAAAWISDMNVSPLQRFDELHNIFIEYTHKPWFALFGKGLGGTTRHYTTLLTWSGLEDFSADQIRMGAFYRMHESLGVIFLQHGLVGLVFFFKVIVMLLKRLYKTPWAMMAVIWFFFYWDYGISLIIGSVILVLAFAEDIDELPTKRKKKRGVTNNKAPQI